MIKNIIFDLGNVVIDIAPNLTYEAFSKLSIKYNPQEIEQTIKQEKLWVDYETGLYSDEEFRNLLREKLVLQGTDHEIDHAFNALLLDIDPKRIELIEQISAQYRTFVLSNTSNIHILECVNILKRCTGRPSLKDLFERVFFSWEMQKVKPNPAIYEQLLAEAGILAEESLFIDDLLPNVQAANALGINIVHLQPPTTILDILPDYLK
jgi:glucose-1-phosphatase